MLVPFEKSLYVSGEPDGDGGEKKRDKRSRGGRSDDQISIPCEDIYDSSAEYANLHNSNMRYMKELWDKCHYKLVGKIFGGNQKITRKGED